MIIRDQYEYMIDRPFGKICTHPPVDCGETGNENIEKYFNNLGKQGWEMCGNDEHGYYFKRKIV